MGTLELLTIVSRDPAPPPASYIASSGGLFRDMMIHDFDLARFLLGEEPVELFAAASCLVDPTIGEAGDVDTATVVLKTASGKLCQISNSRRAVYGYDQRIEAHGSAGLLRAGNKTATTVEVAPRHPPPPPGRGRDRARLHHRPRAAVLPGALRGRLPRRTGRVRRRRGLRHGPGTQRRGRAGGAAAGRRRDPFGADWAAGAVLTRRKAAGRA